MPGDGTIAICATFTAEPLAESLEYWLKLLRIPARLEFASYNQVTQTLLDPNGVFARNRDGLNVVLLRFEDGRNFELIAALQTAASMGTSPILVCVCPASPQALSDPDRQEQFAQLEQELSAGLEGSSMIRFLSSDRLQRLYPVTSYYDAAADQLGHIPYTAEVYAALGTAIIRIFHATRRAPFKVIVTDCDNTLWRGICGESGAEGIQVDDAAGAVQSFLKARQRDGMLLCVCSKNAPEDIERVFDEHPEMPLAKPDFAGWRVNWRPKSENLHSLAAELSLGLNSFIFLDDNPMETAEVAANCPGVLALTLPVNSDNIARFLDHVWAFDQNGTTAEDRKRTAVYRENALRQSVLTESLSYADFLRGLELEVEIRELNGPAEIERAAQMTQRTNQFNCTTRRFSPAEMRAMAAGGTTEMFGAWVRDRYGDYGQVGLVMFECSDGALCVTDFLLSCRVLGKGVEQAMVARLGEIAMERRLHIVDIAYQATAKNAPARHFLASLGTQRISSEVAAALQFSPSEARPPEEPGGIVAVAQGLESPIDYAWIAAHRADAASILRAIEEAQAVCSGSAGVAPRDDWEKRLTRIWERVLRISPIGIHDNFFDLGGDSLAAVRLLSQVRAIGARELPLVTMIEAPTIAQLAEVLRDVRSEPRWNYLAPIKSSGARPPFFCVHGVGGNVLEYVDLARHLHDDQPFYGIQAIGLSGSAPQRKLTVEEMARLYILEMRELQRAGPYYMGGSSFGGLVAYEMARQLTASGQAVGLVAMFDTSAPGRVRLAEGANGWRLALDAIQYRLALHWQNILLLDPRERMSYIRAKLRRVTLRAGNGSGRERLAEIIRSVNEAAQWAASVYVPGEYSGDITLFRAEHQPSWIVSDGTMGWGDLVKGVIEIYDTPGHHADLVRDPRARVLARQLDQALKKARARVSHVDGIHRVM